MNVDWNNWDFCIRIAGNTGPRCLMAIRQKGYSVRAFYDEKKVNNQDHPDYYPTFEAKKAGYYFSATSPEELLGLIGLWETRGDNWREVTQEEWDFYHKLDDEAKIYDEEGNDVTDDD